MAIEKVYNIYFGIDYESLPDESLKLKFSNDAEDICQILNLPEDNYDLYTGFIAKQDLERILYEDINSDKFSGFDILIYIAGHGNFEKMKRHCLLTSDGELRYNDIFELINQNQYPDKIAVILDCCYSGLKETPKRNNMYWIAATSENTTANNQFHENLVDYLSSSNNNLTILGLINHLQLHGHHIEQPSLVTSSNKPFMIANNKKYISIDLNEYFLRKRGRLRTAYPININFSQIFDRGLFIAPIVHDTKKEITLDAYIDSYSTKKSSLILGSPGVGKSFLSFLIQNKLIKLNYTVIALSFQEINDILLTDDSSLNNENIQIKRLVNEVVVNKTDKIVFLIDGLDEFSEWGKYTEYLNKLIKNAGVIAFSREIEYNNNVRNHISDAEFDETLKVKNWQYEQEFNCFLNLLLDKQYINKDKYDNILINAKEFQEHLVTPLHSRMYIYVYEDDKRNGLLLTNKAGLYFSYIQKLTEYDQLINDFWENIAFDAFRKQRNNHSIISESEYYNIIKRYQIKQRRIIPCILQLKRETYGNYYNFIHYSFYEFFVAQFIYSNIQKLFNNTNNYSGSLNLFNVDLSFSIRHYLVDLLRLDKIIQQQQDKFISFLHLLYELIEGNNQIDLTKKNLIIYLISKQDIEIALKCLKNILKKETDIFIKNSLYWACIKNEDDQIFDFYISLLSSSQEYRAYNRGYHLYYYGDIMPGKFPFIDKEQNISWCKTRKFMMNHRITVKRDNPSFIQLLDIWTYIDLAIFHKTLLENEEIISLKNNYSYLSSILNENTKIIFDNLLEQLEGIIR